MISNELIIREILPRDNPQIAQIIRTVLLEFGAPKTGTAYEDAATDTMFETYQNKSSAYFVIEYQQKIIGGCGFALLENTEEKTCELQKMYFLPIARGKGLGSKLIAKCLEKAKEIGFKNCYLETMPYMDAARSLYAKNGFLNLEKPMGNTGHYSCNVWMLKKL